MNGLFGDLPRSFSILDRYYKMSEILELGPKRGKDVPGTKAIVLIDGK